MYIIRTAFLLSAVVFLLPDGNPDVAHNGETQNTAQVSAGDTLGAAISAVGDLSNICTRKPDVCETGSAVWQTFQTKALYGVELLYDWATSSEPASDTADSVKSRPGKQAKAVVTGSFQVSENTAPVYTGSTQSPRQKNSTQPSRRPKSQNTLEIQDLIPQWKGPRANRSA